MVVMKRSWIALSFVLSVVACGSSDGATNYTGPGGGGGPSAVAASVNDYVFAPASFTVKAGTPIRWTNNGAVVHTVTSDSGAFDSGDLATPTGGGTYGGGTAGGSFQHTFATVGVFPFHCNHHAQMTGTITVTP
jgi:plastocyanin